MKYLQNDKLFRITFSKTQVTEIVRPVNGEENFDDVGFSHGIVHFAHPETGEQLGWCGVDYFEKNAVEV